jgi:heat shock protein HspQ
MRAEPGAAALTGWDRTGLAVSHMAKIRDAKFCIGNIVRHRLFPFRGVVFDVDPEFNNTEEWYNSIPVDRRPAKDQPFYHLLAQNAQTHYEAYVSEQNLLQDAENGPVNHPMVDTLFAGLKDGRYLPRRKTAN